MNHISISRPRFALRLALTVAGALLLWCAEAHAAPPPSSGQLLQEAPQAPAPPVQPPPIITNLAPRVAPTAPGEAFFVQHIEVEGSKLLAQDKLRAIVVASEGKSLTLADLQKLADTITALYQKSGYLFSRAYVPRQTVRRGVAKIAVLEAHFDAVQLRNTSRVHDLVPNVVLNQIKSGAAVDQATLDRTLLLVSDIPGTAVKGTLKPGESPGTSTLLVDVAPGPSFYGNASLDDYGNAATGRPRANGGVNFNNPLQLGDVISMSAMTAGRGLNYGRLGYSIPIYGPATQFSLEASSLSYRVVHSSAADLDSRGTAEVTGAGLKQNLFRSTNVNLYAQISFDRTLLRDHIGAEIRTDRHTDDWRGNLFGGVTDAMGVTNVKLGLTLGHLGFDDAAAAGFDGAGPRTAGEFTKYSFEFSRVQQLTSKTSLYAEFDYQGASKNLDSSEQFFVGGPSSVQAYDNGVASGTEGDAITLELRRDLFVGGRGRWQVGAFIDNAHIRVAKDVYGPSPNDATLSGAGVSLNWVGNRSWSVSSSLGTPIGGTPAIAGRRDSVRAWVVLQKAF